VLGEERPVRAQNTAVEPPSAVYSLPTGGTMESALSSLLTLLLILVGFLLILGQGRLLRYVAHRLVSGTVSALGGCIGLLIAVIIGLQFLQSALTGRHDDAPKPTPAKVSVSVSPLPPVEEGTPVVITASSDAPMNACSVVVKDESGKISRLSAAGDETAFHWTAQSPGNYAVILTADTDRGEATARKSVYVCASVLSPPCDQFDPGPLSDQQRFGGPWFDGKRHAGMDLLWKRTDRPTAKAIAAGHVVDVRSFGKGWGQMVVIEHQYQGRTIVSLYGHILPAEGIAKRKPISRGDPVGYVDPGMYGPDGNSAPHLHFGLFDGPYSEFPRRDWGALLPDQFPGRWLDPAKLISK